MAIKGMQIVDLLTDATQQELTAHGDFSFPLGVYENAMNQNVLGFVIWHWHDEIQFNYVTKGTMHFSVDSENFILGEGQGIFINSGCMHSMKPVERPDSTCICIDAGKKLFAAFKGGVIEQKYISSFMQPAIFFDNKSPWSRNILEKLKTIFTIYTLKPFTFELDICSELIAIMSIMLKNTPIKKVGEYSASREDYNKIKKILTHIHNHYADKISLEDIAKIVFLSRNECCRFFKKKTNSTIFEYIIEYRINKSIEYLQNDNMTVGQIASITGFSTASYFTEIFRKHVGCTPREYRRQAKQSLAG